jgi:hypothetical protein
MDEEPTTAERAASQFARRALVRNIADAINTLACDGLHQSMDIFEESRRARPVRSSSS